MEGQAADESWTGFIDGYCERTGPEFWSEPVNALTNAAFLVAAYVMWRRTGGRLPIANVLIVILALIGVGSFLFHTFATTWAALADVVPIGLFVLTYVFAANLRFWRWSWWGAAFATLLFFPYAPLASVAFGRLPFFEISAFYWPIALLIALYGLALLGRAPRTGQGLLIGAAILSVSLVARSVDQGICDALPVGTHFLWHVLNAAMLAWMIEVYRRHMEEGGEEGRGLEAPRGGR